MSDQPVSLEAATAMLKTMAGMQDGFNQLLHPQWRDQGFEFYRAIWIESAEMLDHLGWKWWKHSPPDVHQVQLELVDIWHFGMSDLMREGVDPSNLAAQFRDRGLESAAPVEIVRERIETFAAATLKQREFPLPQFLALLDAIPLPLAALFQLYVGKNILNSFRQENGYRDGSYRKIWAGREDNEHLVDALAELDCAADEVPAALHKALTVRYQASA